MTTRTPATTAGGGTAGRAPATRPDDTGKGSLLVASNDAICASEWNIFGEELCWFTGLPTYSCSHCSGLDWEPEVDWSD